MILVFLIRTTLCPPLVAVVWVPLGVEAVKPCSSVLCSPITVIVSVTGVEGQTKEDSQDQSIANDVWNDKVSVFVELNLLNGGSGLIESSRVPKAGEVSEDGLSAG